MVSIAFTPVGYLKDSCIDNDYKLLLIESQDDLEKLWSTFHKNVGGCVTAPKIDFSSKKLVVIRETLNSSSCFLYVHKITTNAQNSLDIEWSELHDGGSCTAMRANLCQFISIDRKIEVSRVAMRRLDPIDIHEVDSELKGLLAKIQDSGGDSSERTQMCEEHKQKSNRAFAQLVGPSLKMKSILKPAQETRPQSQLRKSVTFMDAGAVIELTPHELADAFKGLKAEK